MTFVYGNTVEPGGMELDDQIYECSCPACGSKSAQNHRYETCDGSINIHEKIDCSECGYHDERNV